MKSRIIVMVVAFWGMTAIWAQDSTPWYMGTWNRIFTPLKKEKGGHKFLGFPFFEMNFKTT